MLFRNILKWMDGWVEQHSHVYMKQSCFVKIHLAMAEMRMEMQRGERGMLSL